MIFVDADAFIGVSVETDPLHSKSSELFRKLKKSKEPLVTSWDVVDETATKLSKFSTKEIANKFLQLLSKSRIEIVFLDSQKSKEVLALFKKQSSKRVSLTDCTNMTIAKSLGIDTIFSFDEHYKKNGFKLLSLK